MTEKIEGKNGNQWQFISDENDIETIMKKLDWIARGIMDLRIHREGGMSPEDLEKYFELFKPILPKMKKNIYD